MPHRMIEPISPEEIQWARQARIDHPKITSYGFGVPSKYEDQWTIKETAFDFRCLETIAICRRWLLEQGWRKTVNSSDCPGSYAVKHMIESWKNHPPRSTNTKYIYEGALVLTVVAMGIPYKRQKESCGIWLGLSRKTIKHF